MEVKKIFKIQIIALFIIFIVNCNYANAVNYVKDGKNLEGNKIEIYEGESIEIKIETGQTLNSSNGSSIIAIDGNYITGINEGTADVQINRQNGSTYAAVGTVEETIKITVKKNTEEKKLQNYIENANNKVNELEEYKKKIEDFHEKKFEDLTTTKDKLLWIQSCLYHREEKKLNNLSEETIKSIYNDSNSIVSEEVLDRTDITSNDAIFYKSIYDAINYIQNMANSYAGYERNYDLSQSTSHAQTTYNNLQNEINNIQESIDSFKSKISVLKGGENRVETTTFLDAINNPDDFKPSENTEETKVIDMLNNTISIITSIQWCWLYWFLLLWD